MNEDYEAIIALMNDPAWRAVCRRAAEAPLTWREFTEMELPDGMGYKQG